MTTPTLNTHTSLNQHRIHLNDITKYALMLANELSVVDARYERVLVQEKMHGTDKMYASIMAERRTYVELYESLLSDVKKTLASMVEEHDRWSAICPSVMCSNGYQSREDWLAAYPFETVGTDVYTCGTKHLDWSAFKCHSGTQPDVSNGSRPISYQPT